MYELDAMLGKFSSAVLSDAMRENEQLLRELEEYRKQQLDRAENELLSESYRYIQSELEEMRGSINQVLSKRTLELKKDIVKKSEQLSAALHAEVLDRLQHFSETDAYRVYLFSLARRIAKEFSICDCRVVLELCPRDMRYADELSAVFGDHCESKENEEITLGGLIATIPDRGIVLEETLDLRLNTEFESFIENNDLLCS